jgi:diguanylate cyclase (GGDEF)-like protein
MSSRSTATFNVGTIWNVVIPVVLLIVGTVGGLMLYLPGALRSAALESTLRSNVEVADQIKIIRGYYTTRVVAKALETGAMQPSIDHAAEATGIPLPATFVKDISDLLSERDLQLALISPYPWPHRSERRMDNFQEVAWEAFQTDPDAVFAREEIIDGQRVMRVAVADRMTAPTCVSCHNNHPDSVRRDWQLNDVRAVMEVSKVVEPYLASAELKSRYIISAVATVAALLIAVLLAIGVLVSRRTKEKNDAVRHLHYLAHHDAMTGLLSRNSFSELVSKEMGGRQAVALHFVDLDRFKDINDCMGHDIGDELIKQSAERLKELCGDQHLLTRFGGDEFVIAQTNVAAPQDALVFGQAIVKGLAQPFTLLGHTINISASVGTSIADRQVTVEELVKRADIALYRAKTAGRNCSVLFAPDMQQVLTRRRCLETRIWEALHAQEFILFFQPILNARTKRLEGFEALIRLPDGYGEMISPGEFIPIAEEIGAIGRIGDWVIRSACRFAATWPEHLTVSVNLSAAQFGRNFEADQGLVNVVVQALKDSGLDPHRLELEITESLVMERTDVVLSELKALRDLGVSIAMDDFGTGYSNLSSLWQLPFTKLKIDQSFAKSWRENATTVHPILDTIASLSRSLGVNLTAEGVETQEEEDLFTRLGCDQLQGYLFGRPIPPSEMAVFLIRHRTPGLEATKSEDRSSDDTNATMTA